MSFILDALRKSEHERQRSTMPGLAQVPVAVPQPVMPRWGVAVIGALAVAVVALGAAWWQSTRTTAAPAAAAPATVERRVELPPPAATAAEPPRIAPRPAAPEPTRAVSEPSLARAASPVAVAPPPAVGGLAEASPFAPREYTQAEPASAAPALPSAAALAAEGVLVPDLRLELHAYSPAPRDRFVFINGRKYVEGERLSEGPQLVAIEPTGVVLAYSGRRFLLRQE